MNITMVGSFISKIMKMGLLFSCLLLLFCTWIAPVFALQVESGDRISLNAERPMGVPLHEFPRPSLVDRVQDGAIATVINVDANQRWINIRLDDGREGWIVERYISQSDLAIEDVPDVSNPAEGEILPDLKGQALLRELDEQFSPRRTLGYGRARDILYTQIDNQNGILRTIYSGFEAPVDPNADKPRQVALAEGVNAEHVWPQSQGATGQAKSDLHHLFPARAEVNGDRSNYPFAEIPDNQTESWYLDDEELNSIPASDEKDLYSEGRRGAFEPRESKKGDIARAIFYFKAIYPEQDAKNFFNPQKSTLCEWDQLDPVDTDEQARSHAIARSPQGNENPFVIDPSLASRTFCR